MSIKEIDKEYVAGTYGRFPVEIVSGKGSVVVDETGKEYIDLTSGIGVTSFGIADDLWVKATTEQLSKVQHMSNLFYTEPCAKLAEILCNKTGMSKVFFCNSGAEANECAIKVARKYKGRSTIVTLNNSFHGRTLTTLSATGQEHYHELFQPLTPGFLSISTIEELEALSDVAGVLIECIQGEGGVVPIDVDFAHQIEEYCKQNDTLLMVDEVQTGNGRTGKMYAYMNYGLHPDVVSTAKGLGGGLPIGAVLMSEKVQDVLGPGDHGSTFGGNPVACAGAISIVNRIDDNLLSEVSKKSKLIFDTFTGAPGVEDVTGLGLMIGIKTVKPAKDVVNTCIEKGVLCLTAKDKVRLLPALNIDEDVLVKALEVIKEVIK